MEKMVTFAICVVQFMFVRWQSEPKVMKQNKNQQQQQQAIMLNILFK